MKENAELNITSSFDHNQFYMVAANAIDIKLWKAIKVFLKVYACTASKKKSRLFKLLIQKATVSDDFKCLQM